MTHPTRTTSRGPEAALDYPRLVRELFPRLTGGIRWGLERTDRLLAEVGHPERAYPVLHVGGTNGKGTVCAVAESILRAAGLRTGLYTSPHLTSFRERIRIDGMPIDEAALLAAARALWPHVEREQPSFFEATTAIAFLAFAQGHVDVGVIEVGLGGRLDATNVVAPEVAVVTQIAVDHVEFLGSDLTSIAGEKAGIAKAGAPFLTGESDAAMLSVLERIAIAAGALVHRLPADVPEVVAHSLEGTRLRFDTDTWGPVEATFPLPGRHQARNAALAVRAIELSALRSRVGLDAVVAGIETTRWPGRTQVERIAGRRWIFDVAHNPSAIERLTETIRDLEIERPLTVLLGVMADKDWRAMISSLTDVADRVVLTRPAHAPAGRAWDPAAAADVSGLPGVLVVSDLIAAVRGLRREATGTVLVTGSFHTVGETMIALGVDPGWEPDPFVDSALQR